MTDEKIDKYLRLRAKGMPTGSMINLKHFTDTEIKELRKLFPDGTKSDWHKFSVKSK